MLGKCPTRMVSFACASTAPTALLQSERKPMHAATAARRRQGNADRIVMVIPSLHSSLLKYPLSTGLVTHPASRSVAAQLGICGRYVHLQQNIASLGLPSIAPRGAVGI